ncbi:AtzE family amidohydrolase [Meridianimarinicoccus roseus]|uniref:AtzE family amidohydrolase n=1 Tax=Meridianimarinicoccus roseus TaxID=2072018 RepID=UPI002378A114|nr:AtzE family amidohydrolase [Meridianimarinicoccus roseus]
MTQPGLTPAGETAIRTRVDTCLRAIDAVNGALNAFTSVLALRARARADALDHQTAAGATTGSLTGVCFGVKALFDVAGEVTLAGARLRETHAPAPRDAFAIRRLEAAGGVLVGSLNMDEFASGFTTENTHYGPTRNPHDPARTAGGSSGGSAAAVAGGMVPLALATDTNGSIRVPAAACGVFGLKPTFGRLSRAGTVLFAESLDHVGPIARDLDMLEAAYDALQGTDPDDPAQLPPPPDPVENAAPLRAALAAGAFFDRCDPAASKGAERAAQALGAARRLDLPGIDAGWSAATVITLVEGSEAHLDELRHAPDAFDPMTRDRFLAGALVPAPAYLAAQRARRLWQSRALHAAADIDVLITPGLPFAPPPLSCDALLLNGETVDPRSMLGLFTQPFSCIGWPAMMVPLVGGSGLPRAVQLVARPWQERQLFRAARQLVAAGVAAAHVVT